MSMENLDIRMLVSDKGITYRAIAGRMGITHTHLSRLMREELKPMQRERILAAISCLDEEKEDAEKEDAEKEDASSCVFCCDEDEDSHIDIFAFDFEKNFCARDDKEEATVEVRSVNQCSVGIWNHNISLCFNDGSTFKTPILYCPMCGRKF